jgi:hypothetical protein
MLTINPMQDVLNPDGYPLIEADAKLLFLKGGHYCFQYRDAGKETYKFLSPETVRAAFQHEQIDSGWIPSGVQRLGICKQGQWFVQFIPPARRTFTFTNLTEDGEPIALTIPMMGLVFMLCGDSCYVWATNFKIFNAEAPIYHVPLPNIYGDGRICMGNENSFSSQLEGIEKLAEAWQMFMNAPFSNHLVNDKSTSHPQDIRLKLLKLQKSNRYPIADLVRCGSSVKVAINMIINQ